jgi:hypothetical protein
MSTVSRFSLIKVWYFVSKIVLVIEKTFEIRGRRPRICKHFEITRTIYSKSERSEQFLVTECFFNLFLEVSHIYSRVRNRRRAGNKRRAWKIYQKE